MAKYCEEILGDCLLKRPLDSVPVGIFLLLLIFNGFWSELLFTLLITFTRRHAALRRDCLYPPARPSVLVSHAPGVTSRFWLARRRSSPLFRPATGLRSPPAARACCARPSPVCPRKPRAWRDIFTIRLLYMPCKGKCKGKGCHCIRL